MNIAFDSEAVMSPTSRNRGIGNYTLGQMKTLIRLDRGNRYFLFNVFGSCDFFVEEVEEGLLTQVDYTCAVDDKFLFMDEQSEVFGELVRKFVRDYQIDIFYITSPIDKFFPRYRKEWFGSCRTCATVYDVIPYVMRRHYLDSREMMEWYMGCVETLRDVDRLLVISQSVKTDLCTHLDFPPEKIDVIWGAVGAQFGKIPVSAEERERLFGRYGIRGKYIMCTGGDDERKNIAALIRAYALLPASLREQYQLVIVCKLQKASVERYGAMAKELGLGEGLVLTNFVSDEELLELYNLAALVAFPSVYEGFGLPVVEAWSCGVPVLTSNNSSLVEIAGDAAVLVDPYSVESIREGLRHALTEADLPALAKRGEERLAIFNWEHVTELTMEAMERIPAPAHGEGENIRKRIAFFTPLPPKQSGISDYSVDILVALAEKFDIDVFLDDGYEPDCTLPENVRCYPHSIYPHKCGAYVETVYQVGNSEYHIYMWPYLRRYGGMLVLHDYNMHGVVQYRTLALGGNDLERYRDYLLEDIPLPEVDEYLEELRRGGAFRFQEMEINGFLSNYADKILVHSQESRRKLLERSAGRSVRCVRSYAKIEPLPDKSAARRALGLGGDELIFAAFGHIHETKRAIPLLRAFARARKKTPEARLIFVGKLDTALEEKFLAELERLKLREAVTVTGYTELENFNRYIDAVDVCMNLRWPYNGETSGSLMRILAKGKCVVVNDVGSFSEIPGECCCRLPSVEELSEGEEENEISKAMLRLAARPEERERLEKNARRFAEEELDLRKIAAQYADYILARPQRAVNENLLGELYRRAGEENWSVAQRRAVARTLACVVQEG